MTKRNRQFQGSKSKAMNCRKCDHRYSEWAGDGTVDVYKCEVTEQIIKKGQVCPLEDMEVKG